MREQQQEKSDKKYWCKIFHNKHDTVGAICDKDILNREMNSKKLGVKVKVTEHFYGGVLITEKAAVNIMRKVTIGNLMGKEIIKLALKNGFITKENTIDINGIPHAQFLKLKT